ncbi:hypothetical protein BJ742DRAFT_677040 [Cladochytrium replicatum]|nr:hypothetical protein BJ742DRAFT_677040 [Cladochytrium replicatum]
MGERKVKNAQSVVLPPPGGASVGVGATDANANSPNLYESYFQHEVNLASREFIKGFVFGQLGFCILAFFLLKLFFFRGSDETKVEIARRKRKQRNFEPKVVCLSNLNHKLRYSYLASICKCLLAQAQAPHQHALYSDVLTRTKYDILNHQPESTEWMNVLIAQLLAKHRHDAAFIGNMVSYLDTRLNGSWKPSVMGPITITEVSLGQNYPVLHSAAIRQEEHSSAMRAEVEFSFDDQITLSVDTEIIINWPKSYMASLPISLAVSVVQFSGTIALEFINHPETNESYASVSVLEDFRLDFEVRSVLGHRTKVKDLPKLTSMLTTKLRSLFADEIVWPRFRRFKFPYLFGPPPAPPQSSDVSPNATPQPQQQMQQTNQQQQSPGSAPMSVTPTTATGGMLSQNESSFLAPQRL